VREACEELDSDFACDFPLLPDELELELDFSSSRFTRVPPEGLTGSASSSLPRSRFQRVLSLGLRPDLDSYEGCCDCCCCWKIGRKKNASAGPGLPAVVARVAAKTTAAPRVGRMRMWKLHCRHERTNW
jgi:hypothetical protein